MQVKQSTERRKMNESKQKKRIPQPGNVWMHSIEVPEGLRNRLKALAKRTGCLMQRVIVDTLLEGLPVLEKKLEKRIARKRSAEDAAVKDGIL